jgi:hypothetical protein
MGHSRVVLLVAVAALFGCSSKPPATGSFTATGSLGTARGYHAASLLPNGKTLIVGGANWISIAELYDASTGTFSATGSLITGRMATSATLLPLTGKVLVAGGFQNTYPTVTYLATSELYQ